MQVDLTPEAVERLEALLQRPYGNITGGERQEAAATLRALSARVVELEAERDKWALSSHGQAWDRITAEAALATARADALREALTAIADLPMPQEEEQMRGHEDAFRVVEALIPQQEKPHE